MPPAECIGVQEPSVVLALASSVQRERVREGDRVRKREKGGERARDNVEIKPCQRPNQTKNNHGHGKSRPHFVNAFGSDLSATVGKQERSELRVK